jgi:ABC-2 type transport system permease protein
MTGFAGTGQLSKLAFRRDGVALPACVFGIAALLAVTARDLTVLYPTAAGRLAVATRASANPALRFLLGRLDGTSVGAFLAARWSVWGAAFAVLLTIFIVVRHTRGDEEAGRLELVGSAAVGRQAPLTAALLAAATANLAIALLTCLWLLVLKLPLAGSAALALSISGLRRRANDQHSGPGRTAAPRPRRPGPLPPGQRGPRPDRRLREL